MLCEFCFLAACNTAFGKRAIRSGSSGSSSSGEFDLDEIDATHRGCHKFIPRHPGELAIEIGDYIYVQVEDDDLWCEGRNIIPSIFLVDLTNYDCSLLVSVLLLNINIILVSNIFYSRQTRSYRMLRWSREIQYGLLSLSLTL